MTINFTLLKDQLEIQPDIMTYTGWVNYSFDGFLLPLFMVVLLIIITYITIRKGKTLGQGLMFGSFAALVPSLLLSAYEFNGQAVISDIFVVGLIVILGISVLLHKFNTPDLD